MKKRDNIYFDYEIFKKFPVLSKEEERKVLIAAKQGDEKSREKIINCNMKYVIQMAFSYNNFQVDKNDLISEGGMGMMDALEHFDIKHDVKFISYATYWIKKRMNEFVYLNSNVVRVPFHNILNGRRVYKNSKIGWKQVIGGALIPDIKEQDLNDFNRILYDSEYVPEMHDEKFDFESEFDIMDFHKRIVDKIKELLTEDEYKMVKLKFGLENTKECSYVEIGKIFKLSDQSVINRFNGDAGIINRIKEICKKVN